MSSLQTERIEVESIVRERFRPYFGEIGDQELGQQVIADSGLDSVGLVMVLTDLFLQVNLDVGDSRVKLRDLRTLDDVVSLIRGLLDGEPVASIGCNGKAD
jgi:acyl carrier protein